MKEKQNAQKRILATIALVFFILSVLSIVVCIICVNLLGDIWLILLAPVFIFLLISLFLMKKVSEIKLYKKVVHYLSKNNDHTLMNEVFSLIIDGERINYKKIRKLLYNNKMKYMGLFFSVHNDKGIFYLSYYHKKNQLLIEVNDSECKWFFGDSEIEEQDILEDEWSYEDINNFHLNDFITLIGFLIECGYKSRSQIK